MTMIEPTGEFTLQTRYEAERGEVLVTGIQALVRLPLEVMRADRRAGLRTATLISGYQGSPLGGFDRELQSQRALLDALDIVHVPAVNEELGATSVMGSQLADTFPTKRFDGVVGIWYGKGPGLDRAGDAIRHANFAGTARRGGVLALVGDDSAAKSSTIPSRSDPLLSALFLPVLYPGTVQEILDLGHHAVAMSRASGLWIGFKVTTPVADGSGLASVGVDRFSFVPPSMEIDGRPWTPTLTGEIGPPNGARLEAEVLGPRMEIAQRYIAANGLNRMLADADDAWLTVIAGGYDAEQVLDALRVLGVPRHRLAEFGIRLLKLGALNPLDRAAVRHAVRGVATVLVVEDKVDFLETRVRSAIYGHGAAPAVIGRVDHDGRPLIHGFGALTSDNLIEALRRVLTLRIGSDRLAPLPVKQPFRLTLAPEAVRTPFFCSGCPHNTGLLAPEGAMVGAGIGCHGMVTIVPRPENGVITGLTQMGGEGAQWIGIAPFVTTPHLFQNIGDGTFFHSGQLAVQAAVSAGTTVTFKLLYNAAVAMTGGQDAAGLLPVPAVARKLLAEGVKQVVITTDDPDKYRRVELPSGVRVAHRDRIIEVQEDLAKVGGVTVLIHDQQCAAEKRRDRKRGILAPAAYRVMIDERVCEGCGDCGVQSNCMSLHPHETDFGRKTMVDQAGCNVDASCLRGDCPAFITVKPGTKRPSQARQTPPSIAELPVPSPRFTAATIRMPGIGGTGVVTVSQVLVAAARIAGLPGRAIDQTGLSQKGGPVVSTVTIGEPRAGRVDTLLGLDALTTATSANLADLEAGHSVAVVSTSLTPTARMVGKLDTMAVDLAPLLAEIDARTDPSANRRLDAVALTTALLGSAVTANVLVLGAAAQAGLIPLPVEAIERAIELNGAAVEANLASFRWGRHWAHDPLMVEHQASRALDVEPARFAVPGVTDPAVRSVVERLAADLVRYQGQRYARRYADDVVKAHQAEVASGGDGSFTEVVARRLHQVMAYKDEYEVAALLLDGRSRVHDAFGDDAAMTWHLHPPMLRSLGLGSKLRFGRWSTPVMAALRAGRRVRGTPLDPFGYASVRRTERALIGEYRDLVAEAAALLATDRGRALRLVGLVDQVKGFEAVKLRNIARYRESIAAERSR